MTINKSVTLEESLEMINKFIKGPLFKETSLEEKKLIIKNKLTILSQLLKNKLTIMENQERKPLFFYGTKNFSIKNKKDVKIERRITLAGTIDNDGIITIGRAICSENDQFIKKKARLIASGRSIKKPFDMVKVKEGETPAKAFVEYAKKHLKEEE